MKLATLDSITQIVVHTHQVSPPNSRSSSQRLSVCHWCHCTLLIMFTDKKNAMCLVVI